MSTSRGGYNGSDYRAVGQNQSKSGYSSYDTRRKWFTIPKVVAYILLIDLLVAIFIMFTEDNLAVMVTNIILTGLTVICFVFIISDLWSYKDMLYDLRRWLKANPRTPINHINPNFIYTNVEDIGRHIMSGVR